MSAQPNLFDSETQRLLGELHGVKRKPNRDEYLTQLRKWCDEAGAIHTPAEIERIAADQARLVEQMGRE